MFLLDHTLTHHLRDSKNHHISVLVKTGLRKGRRHFNVCPLCSWDLNPPTPQPLFHKHVLEPLLERGPLKFFRTTALYG